MSRRCFHLLAWEYFGKHFRIHLSKAAQISCCLEQTFRLLYHFALIYVTISNFVKSRFIKLLNILNKEFIPADDVILLGDADLRANLYAVKTGIILPMCFACKSGMQILY